MLLTRRPGSRRGDGKCDYSPTSNDAEGASRGRLPKNYSQDDLTKDSSFRAVSIIPRMIARSGAFLW